MDMTVSFDPIPPVKRLWSYWKTADRGKYFEIAQIVSYEYGYLNNIHGEDSVRGIIAYQCKTVYVNYEDALTEYRVSRGSDWDTANMIPILKEDIPLHILENQ